MLRPTPFLVSQGHHFANLPRLREIRLEVEIVIGESFDKYNSDVRNGYITCDLAGLPAGLQMLEVAATCSRAALDLHSVLSWELERQVPQASRCPLQPDGGFCLLPNSGSMCGKCR